MKIAIVYDNNKSDRFFSIIEALGELRHVAVCLDFSSDSFISDLMRNCVDAALNATGGKNNRTLIQLLNIFKIPLLCGDYCYRNLNSLLNTSSGCGEYYLGRFGDSESAQSFRRLG